MIDEDKIEDDVKEPDETDKQQEPSSDDESVKDPSENRPSVAQIARLRQERRDLRERLEQYESKKDELPNESPLEQWMAENPDEDDIPKKVLVEENRYNRQFNQRLLEKQRAQDRAERQKEVSEARERELANAFSADEEIEFYSQMCKTRLDSDRMAALQEDCAGKSTTEVVALVKKYGVWAAANSPREVDRIALKHFRSKSKSTSKQKPETPETEDGDLDFTQFETGGVYDDVGFKPQAYK